MRFVADWPATYAVVRGMIRLLALWKKAWMMTPNFFNFTVSTYLKKIHTSNSISAKFPSGLTRIHVGVADPGSVAKALSGQPYYDIGGRCSMA